MLNQLKNLDWLDEYRRAYPNDNCFFLMPSGKAVISNEEGQEFIEPNGETRESFLDRLERSKKAG